MSTCPQSGTPDTATWLSLPPPGLSAVSSSPVSLETPPSLLGMRWRNPRYHGKSSPPTYQTTVLTCWKDVSRRQLATGSTSRPWQLIPGYKWTAEKPTDHIWACYHIWSKQHCHPVLNSRIQYKLQPLWLGYGMGIFDIRLRLGDVYSYFRSLRLH